jgi:hypothetical protein
MIQEQTNEVHSNVKEERKKKRKKRKKRLCLHGWDFKGGNGGV